MRIVGLLGGMSWESTSFYYRRLNQLVQERLGGLHSMELLLWSVDFAEMEKLQADGNWTAAGERLAECGRRLARSGAEALVLCTNTMHIVAQMVEAGAGIPILHVADPTGAALRAAGCRRPLLLATRYTMEEDFYTGYLRDKFGLSVHIPDDKDRPEVHRVIFEELCLGVVKTESKDAFLSIVSRAQEEYHVDSVILGCTEVHMLLSQADLYLPVFDTTELHARAAVDFALS
jgi:aspartate racemase